MINIEFTIHFKKFGSQTKKTKITGTESNLIFAHKLAQKINDESNDYLIEVSPDLDFQQSNQKPKRPVKDFLANLLEPGYGKKNC